MRRLTVLLLLLVVAACGGGGGGGPGGPAIVAFDLGLLSSTAPTPVLLDLTNPSGQSADVSPISNEGPFRINTAALPLNVAGGADFQLPILFEPGGATGVMEGTIVVGFTSGSTTELAIELRAEAEVVAIRVLTEACDFGEVLLGESADRNVDILNLSTVSYAHINPVALPNAAFRVQTPLPMVIPPSTVGQLTLRYAPTEPGLQSGPASIQSADPLGPYTVDLTGVTSGREFIDLGDVPFDIALAVPGVSAQTADLQFTVPADAISFQIEAYADVSTQVGLTKLRGPNDEDFENEGFSGFYLQYPDYEAFAAQVPNTDIASQQVIPGTWTLRIGRLAGTDPTVEVRVILQRRPNVATKALAALDMNVYFAQAIKPTTQAELDDVDEIFGQVSQILSQEGITIGDIDYYDIADLTATPAMFDDVTNAEFDDLLMLSGHSSVQHERLNFFLVRTAIGGGVLGVSAKLGGATRNGTGSAGVMGLYVQNPDASDKDLVARVTAHEIGHYIGLRHTAESNGANDDINDTANCGSGGCGIASQLYLMHWNASPGGDVVTPGQGLVIRGHAYMRAVQPPAGSPLFQKQAVRSTSGSFLMPQNWCGTCARCKSKYELGLGR